MAQAVTPLFYPQIPEAALEGGSGSGEWCAVKSKMAAPYEEPNAFRSVPMSFVQILMQREAAHDTVQEVCPTPFCASTMPPSRPSPEVWRVTVVGCGGGEVSVCAC
jgi:hypothetical protein